MPHYRFVLESEDRTSAHQCERGKSLLAQRVAGSRPSVPLEEREASTSPSKRTKSCQTEPWRYPADKTFAGNEPGIRAVQDVAAAAVGKQKAALCGCWLDHASALRQTECCVIAEELSKGHEREAKPAGGQVTLTIRKMAGTDGGPICRQRLRQHMLAADADVAFISSDRCQCVQWCRRSPKVAVPSFEAR